MGLFITLFKLKRYFSFRNFPTNILFLANLTIEFPSYIMLNKDNIDSNIKVSGSIEPETPLTFQISNSFLFIYGLKTIDEVDKWIKVEIKKVIEIDK